MATSGNWQAGAWYSQSTFIKRKKKKRLYRQSESHGTYKYLEITTLAVDILVPVNGIGIDGIIFTVLGISAKYLKKKKNLTKKKKKKYNCKL